MCREVPRAAVLQLRPKLLSSTTQQRGFVRCGGIQVFRKARKRRRSSWTPRAQGNDYRDDAKDYQTRELADSFATLEVSDPRCNAAEDEQRS
jgi:hypothetical protein